VGTRILAFERAAGSRPLTAFVNVGGSQASLGRSPAILQLPGGWVRAALPAADDADGGLITRMAGRGIPVLHLLNVRTLALKWGVQ
jgi:poly-gamma-glutamate system protein